MSTEPDCQLQEHSGAVRLSSLATSGGVLASASTETETMNGIGPITVVTPSASTAAVDVPAPTSPVNPRGGGGAGRSRKTPETGMELDDDARKNSLSIEPTTAAKTLSNTCQITLLLPTSARHPYRIDEKYLSKRNVSTPQRTLDGKPDPFSISVYTLKELILREWREEWDTAPASPGSIRLIFFGKLLDDKLPLSGTRYGKFP